MALRRDVVRLRAAAAAVADIARRQRSLSRSDQHGVGEREIELLSGLVDRAREALVRARPEQRLEEIAAWATTLQARIAARAPTRDDLHALYQWSREYFVRQRRQHRFPGAYFVKAVNLAIKGLHYEIVMHGIVRDAAKARDKGNTTELKEREGMSAAAAALEAARLRFRPILMTSLAFIFGVLPLALSTGAGAGARRSVGTGVMGGMLAATFLAIFFVPMFFKLLATRRLRESRTTDEIREEIRHSSGVVQGETQHCFHHAPHNEVLDTPQERGNA